MAELIPQGTYTVSVEEVLLDADKEGVPQFSVSFAVEGQRRYARLSCRNDIVVFENKTPWDMSQPALRLLKWNGDFDNPQFDPPQTIRVKCKHNQGKGENAHKIFENWYIQTPREMSPAGRSMAAALQSKFRASFGATPPKPAAKPAPAPAPARTAPPARSAPPASGPTTREECWAELDKAHGDKLDEKGWYAAIKIVSDAEGKSESQFGPDEWKAVFAAYPPF